MIKFTAYNNSNPVFINPQNVKSVSRYRNNHWMQDCTGIKTIGGDIVDVCEDAEDVAAAIGLRLAGAAAPVSEPTPAAN